MHSGTILRLGEICSQGHALIGQSVRTVGRIASYDVTCSVAILEIDGHRLKVDTRLVEPQPFRQNSLFQMIGEVDDGGCVSSSDFILLRARVCRCVDGLDMKLYYEALDMRRRCGPLVPDNTQLTNTSI